MTTISSRASDDAVAPGATGGATEPPRAMRRALVPALVLAGCAAAGALVALALPPQTTRAGHPPAAPAAVRLYVHPEPMVFRFNPRHARGHQQAKIAFSFVYAAERRDVEPQAGADRTDQPAEPPPVLRAIALNWQRAYSRCLEALSAEKASAHLSARGKERIKGILARELSAALFPAGIAAVRDVLWQEYFVQ